MAKKSSSGHHKPMPAHGKGAARKQQAPERTTTATLVRSADAPTPSAANVVAEVAPVAPTPQPEVKAAASTPVERKPSAPAPKAAAKSVAKPVAKPAAPAPSSATPAPSSAAPAARPAAVSTREQNVRVARARATQRARQANLIAAENYAYVIGDLKLVVALAVTAFAVLIALTFVLPH